MQVPQARALDQRKHLPAWEPGGRSVPSRLRWRLLFSGFGWFVLLVVLTMLIATDITLAVQPSLKLADHRLGVLLAVGLLALAGFWIGADVVRGWHRLHLLRIGTSAPADVRTVRAKPGRQQWARNWWDDEGVTTISYEYPSGETTRTHTLVLDYELHRQSGVDVLYEPAHPEEAIIISSIPGDPILDADAVRLRHPISRAFLILPTMCAVAAAVLGVLVAVL